jgi:hypothetical protein
MNSDPLRDWRRWVAADRDGRPDDPDDPVDNDEADAAFAGAFKAVPVQVPKDGFDERVIAAIARARAQRARATRAAMAGATMVGVVLTAALIWELPRILRMAVDVSVGAVVWSALAFDRGLDLWSIFARLASAARAVIVAPQATFAMVGLGLIALAALYVLQRMLDAEERSSP